MFQYRKCKHITKEERTKLPALKQRVLTLWRRERYQKIILT